MKKEEIALKNELPLVSIVIPSFKAKYFAQALASVVGQTYRNTEVIVSDNCPDDAVKKIVDMFSKEKNIVYFPNPEKLHRNTQQCFELSTGKYIKFLLDDDLLHPDCVRRMVSCFETYGEVVTLVTSRRRKIDARGNLLPDDRATKPFVYYDQRLSGRKVGNFILVNTVNVIGEFTTAMFRKKDLNETRPYFFAIGGREYIGLNDLSTWISLLSKGDTVYLTDTLSYFRIHGEQNTAAGNEHVKLRSVIEWYYLIKDAKSLGFLHKPKLYEHALQNFLKLVNSVLKTSGFRGELLKALVMHAAEAREEIKNL